LLAYLDASVLDCRTESGAVNPGGRDVDKAVMDFLLLSLCLGGVGAGGWECKVEGISFAGLLRINFRQMH
jgi:hypothetical protein